MKKILIILLFLSLAANIAFSSTQKKDSFEEVLIVQEERVLAILKKLNSKRVALTALHSRLKTVSGREIKDIGHLTEILGMFTKSLEAKITSSNRLVNQDFEKYKDSLFIKGLLINKKEFIKLRNEFHYLSTGINNKVDSYITIQLDQQRDSTITIVYSIFAFLDKDFIEIPHEVSLNQAIIPYDTKSSSLDTGSNSPKSNSILKSLTKAILFETTFKDFYNFSNGNNPRFWKWSSSGILIFGSFKLKADQTLILVPETALIFKQVDNCKTLGSIRNSKEYPFNNIDRKGDLNFGILRFSSDFESRPAKSETFNKMLSEIPSSKKYKFNNKCIIEEN